MSTEGLEGGEEGGERWFVGELQAAKNSGVATHKIDYVITRLLVINKVNRGGDEYFRSRWYGPMTIKIRATMKK